MKNNFQNLSRLTLVMVTYERQKYALRNMDYWSNTGVILRVLDGSNTPIEDNLLDSFGKNILYKHDQILAPEKRINNILSEIDTEYVALIGDDEFYIGSALVSCMEELDKDDSLTVCCGCGVGFDPDKDTGEVYSWEWGDNFIDYNEVMYSDPIKRLESHMRNYEPTLIYGVTRVQPWKAAFETIASKKFDFFTAFEIQYEMLLSFAGKGKIIKELMWLRSAENTPLYDDHNYKGIEPEMELQEWWANNKKGRSEFIEIMGGGYEKINPVKGVDYNNIVILGYYAHMEFRNIFPLRRKVAKIRGFIKRYTPKIFIALRRRNRRRRYPIFSDSVILLSNKGIKVDFKCVKEVEKYISSFYVAK
jgi:glycosyltransferase domain-containing protein